MSKALSTLGKALDRQSWLWLQEVEPEIATAVETEVDGGARPEDIRRFVTAHCGPDREKFAKRCEGAARHLQQHKSS